MKEVLAPQNTRSIIECIQTYLVIFHYMKKWLDDMILEAVATIFVVAAIVNPLLREL